MVIVENWFKKIKMVDFKTFSFHALFWMIVDALTNMCVMYKMLGPVQIGNSVRNVP